MSRSKLRLAVLLLFVAATGRACYATDATCDRIYRLRAESLDDLLHKT
jgi:hypothetical protein